MISEVQQNCDGDNDNVVKMTMQSLLEWSCTEYSRVRDDYIRRLRYQEVAGDSHLHQDQDQETHRLVASVEVVLLVEHDEEDDLDEEGGEDDVEGERNENPDDSAHDGTGAGGEQHAADAGQDQTWQQSMFCCSKEIFFYKQE